jgi:hypothetical protein
MGLQFDKRRDCEVKIPRWVARCPRTVKLSITHVEYLRRLARGYVNAGPVRYVKKLAVELSMKCNKLLGPKQVPLLFMMILSP